MHVLSAGWLVPLLIFLGMELIFSCPMSLWSVAKVIGRLAAVLAGPSMEAQLAVFMIVSFLTLTLMCPVAFTLGR